MDTSLWHDFHKPVPEHDPTTKKPICSPLIIKTDNGPGRLATDTASMKFCEEMAELGVYILLGLPNVTETQDGTGSDVL